ncbi:ribonuclease HI family protein [Acetohalobium arabaticum]|uniref:Ribonuclease H n=1 Tax=Acetohalobium arabaticum (strain ATCC 49924 / DSM 5501 / Z-7288) TaxID=574087 RepID=D9QVH8_ACEAZ|nr:ribonuclease HI family protein [Acetohalobium arabaticum]ADL12237.1 ribonuclease H [Acetohalobium arabaticum DSM 5501]
MELNIYTDGASRGNPGPGGIGVLIKDGSNNIKEELADYIGEATNNEAEYQAIIAGLKKARELNSESISLFSDSQLVIKQLTGEYRVRSEKLKPYYLEIKELLQDLPDCDFQHIPREENHKADELANLGIDQFQQSRVDSIGDVEQLVAELDEETAEFETSADIESVIDSICDKLNQDEGDSEECLKSGIIYGLLLADKINK